MGEAKSQLPESDYSGSGGSGGNFRGSGGAGVSGKLRGELPGGLPGVPGRSVTWAVLLGRWVELAKSVVAMPKHGLWPRLRACVPDIIMLQAIWFALENLGELDDAERALGLDRADVLVAKHTAHLQECWEGQAMPNQLAELIRDVQSRLESARKTQRVNGTTGGDPINT